MNKKFQEIATKIWQKEDRVLLAVSGGVDSMVLFQLFQALDDSVRPQLAVAHVNHQLRSISLGEEISLKSIIAAYHVPFYAIKWDYSEHPVSGIEEAARNFRYSYFKKLMANEGYDYLVTAHHLDDQAETVLMKLVRGSLLEHLTGMKQTLDLDLPNGKTGVLVRPLLDFTKEEIISYAADNKIDFFEDETNSQLTYSRNRYRNQVMPLLMNENARANEQITLFAYRLEKQNQTLSYFLDQTIPTIFIQKAKASYTINKANLLTFATSIQEALVQRFLETTVINQGLELQTSHIAAIKEFLINEKPQQRLDLPNGLVISKSYDTLTFAQTDAKEMELVEPNFVNELRLNRWTLLPDGNRIGLFLDGYFEDSDWLEELGEQFSIQSYVFDKTAFSLPLSVRHRLEGDRIQLQGMDGSKKVNRYFIDAKLPDQERDASWLVVDKFDQVAWIINHRTSQKLRQESGHYQLIFLGKKA